MPTAGIVMSTELIVVMLTGFVMWTGAVVGLTLYLHNKFRSLEVAFYRGLGRHRKEIDHELANHRGRIQRLEIMVGGSTLDRFAEAILDQSSEG